MTFLCCFAFGEKHVYISGVFITAMYRREYCHYFASEKKKAPRLQDIFLPMTNTVEQTSFEHISYSSTS